LRRVLLVSSVSASNCHTRPHHLHDVEGEPAAVRSEDDGEEDEEKAEKEDTEAEMGEDEGDGTERDDDKEDEETGLDMAKDEVPDDISWDVRPEVNQGDVMAASSV
jgi:hypothetical protein